MYPVYGFIAVDELRIPLKICWVDNDSTHVTKFNHTYQMKVLC